MGSYTEADRLLDRKHFHLAFLDLRLAEDARALDGKKLARKIVELDEGTSIVIATGHADVSTAIAALKEWKVLDFILKDAWDPVKVAQLVHTGVPAARRRYHEQYESALAFLAGDAQILSWSARVLELIAPGAGVAHPERRLGDFLNALLVELYPLLPEGEQRTISLQFCDATAGARFWSKALGSPIVIRFGQQEAIHREATCTCNHFAAIERSVYDDGLGLQGLVYLPTVPRREAFAGGC